MHKDKVNFSDLSCVAIITARGGSKGLIRKNVLDLLGKPLIAYSIEAAKSCSFIKEVYVSTEDNEIAQISQQYGANIIERPSELATDTALSCDTIRHALQTLNGQGQDYDYFVLLQPTSPLRTTKHISDCLFEFYKSNARCAISFCEEAHHPYKSFIMQDEQFVPLFEQKYIGMPRGKLPPVYRQNGAIYAMKITDFLNEAHGFYLPPVMPYIMNYEDSVDIDSLQDLNTVSQILNKKIKYYEEV